MQEIVDKLSVLHTDDETSRNEAEKQLRKAMKVVKKKGLKLTGDESLDEASVLNMPFVVLPRVHHQVAPHDVASRMANAMSQDTASMKRMSLGGAHLFQVGFQSWDNCFPEVLQAPSFLENDQEVIGNAVLKMFEGSCLGYPVGVAEEDRKAKKEVLQLAFLSDGLNRLLGLFGFEMDVFSPPADDFKFLLLEEKDSDEEMDEEVERVRNVFLVGEGKDATALPDKALPPKLSCHLCIFGFASWLVSNYEIEMSSTENSRLLGEANELAKRLKQKLHLTPDRPTKETGEEAASGQKEQSKEANEGKTKNLVAGEHIGFYRNALQSLERGELDATVQSVIENRQNMKIGSMSALQVWGAVMQACFTSIKKKKKFTMVLSVKNMWFIELKVQNGKTLVLISDPVVVGSPGSNLKLLFFLGRAKTGGDMPTEDQERWEISLPIEKKKGGRGGPSMDGNGRAGSDGDHGRHKKFKKDSAADGKSEEDCVAPWSPCYEKGGELVDKQVASEECLSQDEYGVVVPYFHQIDDVVGVLGTGRCGEVKKIKWRNGFAAKKEYMLDPSEDGRYNVDVFEHERDMLFELKDLWGKYVPRLLFHKNWPKQPVLGLQVGNPMPHEWSEWSKEEVRQADEAIAAVKRAGWIHHDLEARNFVRLTNEGDGTTSIAVIDFEDAHKV